MVRYRGRERHPDRIASVREALDEVVEREIDRIELGLELVAFVGMSQGAIKALDAVAWGHWQVGALVSIAGLLPSGLRNVWPVYQLE